MKTELTFKIEQYHPEPKNKQEEKVLLDMLKNIWYERTQVNLAIDGGHSSISVQIKKVKEDEED
jgi:hypothetical protein